MAAGGRDDRSNFQWGITNEEENASESSVEQPDNDIKGGWDNSEDTDTSDEGDDRMRSVAFRGVTLGATGVATETARRLGTDRHAEAGFAEQAYAEAYAQKFGGTVIDDGASVFMPDGGVDRVVKTASGEIAIQSKHYGRPVRNNTLEEYANKVDVIGATNGVAESADPEAYGMDVVTPEDWSWQKRVKLQGQRVIRGFGEVVDLLKFTTRVVVSRLIRGAKFGGSQARTGGKWLHRRLNKIGSTIAAWFTRRSLLTQLILVVAAAGLFYILWRWFISEDEKTADDEDPTAD